MRVRWTPAALADLAATEAYIAGFNPAAARRLAREILVAADSLRDFPDRGRPGLEPGTRELVALRPYIIIYRPKDPDLVEIPRVLHGARSRGPGGVR